MSDTNYVDSRTPEEREKDAKIQVTTTYASTGETLKVEANGYNLYEKPTPKDTVEGMDESFSKQDELDAIKNYVTTNDLYGLSEFARALIEDRERELDLTLTKERERIVKEIQQLKLIEAAFNPQSLMWKQRMNDRLDRAIAIVENPDAQKRITDV